MNKLSFALALVALFSMNLIAQDCGDCGSNAKKTCDGGVCTAATLTKKQAEAKKDCCGSEAKLASKPQDEKKAPKTDEVIKRGQCHGSLSSGCDQLDAYLTAEKAAAKGCETSKAKLAAMTKESPKLPEMAQLYKNACNGCEKSAAKLASLRKDAKPQEEPKAKSADCGSTCGSTCETGAKTVKAGDAKADCGGSADKLAKAKTVKADGSGCDKLDAYLACEKAAAKGCETSKAKLAAMTKESPKLPEMAQLYKNSCNGCEKSAAKLAEMKKAAAPAKKATDCGSCEVGAKTVKATEAKTDCCGSTDKLAKAKTVKADGSGCDKLDAYLACEKAAAKGCETSKAKLAAMTKESPKLPEMAQLYKNSCNGCEKSAAKLAEMKKAAAPAAKPADCGSCETGAKTIKAEMKKSDCEGTCGDACGDACEEGKTIGATKAPKVIKAAPCCGETERKGPEPKSALKDF